ncbi:MAG: hypothetical protein KY459_04840 [Acidobacteria bacterium]|nr:hypothetical protein [Acidobacteriota bacterium]
MALMMIITNSEQPGGAQRRDRDRQHAFAFRGFLEGDLWELLRGFEAFYAQ